MLMGCDQMWRGIEVNEGAALYMKGNNVVADAQYAVYVHPKTGLNQPVTDIVIEGNDFVSNFVGIYIAEPSSPGRVINTVLNNNFKIVYDLKPPFTGQTAAPEGLPEQNNYPLAGMYINEVQSPLSISNNKFEKLASGVVIFRNRGTTIHNNQFTNMSAFASAYPAYPYAGHAINMQGNGPGYLLATDNTISSCSDGIITNRTSLEAYGNTLSAVGTGISAFRLNGGFVDIGGDNASQRNDLLGVTRNGIAVSVFDFNASVNIINNKIETEIAGTGASARGGIFLGANLAQTEVRDNIIDVNKSNSGIWLYWGGDNTSLLDNVINIDDPALAVAGIHLTSANGSTIQNNEMLGNGMTGTENYGLWINYAYDNAYCNNTFDNTRYGTYVTGISDSPNNFKCNDFSNHETGLRLDGDNSLARIGSQFHRKNCWGSASGGAVWEGVTGLYAQDYPFDVDQSVMPCFMPSSVMPIQGWFRPTQDSEEVSCTETTCDPDEFNHESEDAIRIAQGNIDAGNYTDAVRWVLYRYLYEKAYGLSTSEPSIQSFFNTHSHSTVGNFYSFAQGLSALYNGNPVEMSNMDMELTGLTIKMEDLAVTDEQIMHASGARLSELRAYRSSLIGEIDSIMAIIQNNYQTINTDRINDASTLKGQNASITVQEVYEVNEKAVNEVYLSYLGREATHLTTSEQQALQAIAVQCPLAGGSAVFKARILLALESGVLPDYDDASACHNGGGAGAPAAGEDPGYHIIQLYPNPAKNRVTLDWNVPIELDGQLEIYDALGKHLSTIILKEGSSMYSLSLNGMSPGLYFIKARMDDKEKVLRLVIQP